MHNIAALAELEKLVEEMEQGNLSLERERIDALLQAVLGEDYTLARLDVDW